MIENIEEIRKEFERYYFGLLKVPPPEDIHENLADKRVEEIKWNIKRKTKRWIRNITRKVATEPIHKMENKKAQKWTKDGGNQMVESLLTLFKRMKEKSRGVFRTHSNIYDGASLRK